MHRFQTFIPSFVSSRTAASLITLLFMIQSPLTSHAATVDRSKQPAPGPAPAAAFPEFAFQTLGNGLRLFVVEDDRKPTVTMRLMIRSGSALDPEGKTGVASFMASLLNRGTSTMDAAAFAKEVDSLGGAVEASATPDAIYVTVSGLTRFTDRLLSLFTAAVLDPVFPEQELQKEKRRALSALVAESQSPDALAAKLQKIAIFGTHPYGRFRTADSIQAIQRSDLTAYHKQEFLPNNASLAIIGDVSRATITPIVEKAFASWKPGNLPAATRVPNVASNRGGIVHLVNRPGSVQSNIVIVHTAPPRNFPELPEVNVMNATLGGGFSGRLFQNLREKNGFTYGAYSAFGFMATGGSFQASAEVRNEVTGAAITEILKEMRRIRDESVPESELALQRQYNIGNFLLSLESAARVAQRIQDIDLYGLPQDTYKTYATRMEQTDAEKMREVAKRYVLPDQAAIVVVGEAAQIRDQLAPFGEIWEYTTELKRVAPSTGAPAAK
jgi:predicted Zn-dependent peptidase